MSARPDPYAEMERLRARVDELERALAAPSGATSATTPESFRALVEHSHDFVAIAGLDGRLGYLNAAGRELIGLAADEDAGALALADLVPAERLEALQTVELPAVRERGLWQGRNELRDRRNGAAIPVQSRRFLLRPHPAAAPVAIATVAHCLAERIQTEGALSRRVELERLVASISQGFIHCDAEALDVQIEVTLELLGAFVGADRSHLMLASPAGDRVSVSHEWCAPGRAALGAAVQDVATSGLRWSRRRLVAGDVIHVAGLESLPAEAQAERALLASLGIASLLVVPLVAEGRTAGCIGFNRAEPGRAWAVADINLLRTVADLIANALARQRIERELRASEQKFARMFAASPDLIAVSTIDEGVFVEVNAAFEKVTGHARAEAIGRSTHELGLWVDLADRTRLVAMLERDGGVVDFETRFRRRSGEVFDGLVSAFPMEVGGRACVAVITRDVSERKSMELALRRSEYVLRAIVENIPDAVWMKDREGRFIVGNRALARFLGRRTLAEVIGRSVAELLPPAQAERLARDDAIVSQTRSQLTNEERYDLRGETRWFETVKAPVIAPGGEVLGTTGISHNITQRKLAEQALRESEARFRQFAEDLPFFIWMAPVDRSRVLFVNKSYERIFGRSIDALRANPADWLEAVHPEDRGRIPTLEAFAAQRGLFLNEFRIVRPDGSERWLRNHVIPLENEKGEVYLHAGISEDVTERKAAEAEVRQLNADLEERVRNRTAALQASLNELESFSYSVSHDLSTPLRGINGFSHLLLEDFGERMDPAAIGYLKRIGQASERMGVLIDDLLTLARLSRAEIRPVELDLSRIAGEILADHAFHEPQRRVEVRIAPGMKARGDATLVQLLLANLLGNAWKFTARQPAARIEMGMSRGRAREFHVRDNGAGFDSAYCAKLFQPFQRLHGIEEFPGSGIGLATVKRIVERHGGSVRAEGQPGAGASFYFTLP